MGLCGWAINGPEESYFFRRFGVSIFIIEECFYNLQITVNHLINKIIALKVV
jgi:hypothetical protein